MQKQPKTTGGFLFDNDPLKQNYYDLLVAIYKQAIEDAVFARGADAANAKIFLQKNPYGLNVDFDGIIKKLRGGENEKN